MDYFSYKDYVLDNIQWHSNYISTDNINNYEDFAYYIQYDINDLSKKKYLVGYLLDTINGSVEIPVYNIKLGNLKNKLHQELINKYQKLQVNLVYNLDLPYDILNIIEGYLN